MPGDCDRQVQTLSTAEVSEPLPDRLVFATDGGFPNEAHSRRVLRFESIAVGVVNAAYQFVAVLVTRLGGSPLEIALLTAMPYAGAVFLAIPVGHHLQSKPGVVRWYSRSRLLTSLPYGATAIAVQAPAPWTITAILVVWAFYSVPGVVTSVTLPMIMDGLAGPRGRLALMGLRWSTQVLVTGISVLVIGQILSITSFPLGYQIVLAFATVAGMIGAWLASNYQIPPPKIAESIEDGPRWDAVLRSTWHAVDFRRFLLCELVYLGGVRLAIPLVPIYFVRVLGATDASIGLIATMQAFAQMAGYLIWPRASAKWGIWVVPMVVLPVAAAYPALLAQSERLEVVAILATLAALFTAGVDLVLFDQMLRTAPSHGRAAFVAVHVTVGNATQILAPLIGAAIASASDVDLALQAASLMAFLGAGLFVVHLRRIGVQPSGMPASQPMELEPANDASDPASAT